MNREMHPIFYGIIATIIGVCAVSVVWMYNNREETRMDETIVLNGESQKELDVSLTGFYPGLESSYIIQLKAKEAGNYKLNVAFEETGAKDLAPFIDVKILLGEEEIGTAKLSEYLGGKTENMQMSFADTSVVQNITIVYAMGEEVGDEAQNTVADFKLLLKEERV